jgi:hypothetical protein
MTGFGDFATVAFVRAELQNAQAMGFWFLRA